MDTICDKDKSILLKNYIDSKMDKDFSILSKEDSVFLILNLQSEVVFASQLSQNFFELSNDGHKWRLRDLFVPILLNSKQTFFNGRNEEKLDTFHSQIKVKDGCLVDVNVTSIPLFYKEVFIGCYLVIEELSSRQLTIEREKQYNKVINELMQLSEKQATAGHLAAGIAHEIRNPITAIKGFMQLLQENMTNKSYFRVINSEIVRIEGILKELMVLVKPNKQKFERVTIPILLEQVVTLMESQALLNCVSIEKSFDIDHVYVMGDSNQLKQVFINYIKNAIEAMPNGGKLKLKAITNQSHAKIMIEDEGDGILEEHMERIGDIFFTTKENGTGLGMLVSEQIIHEHGGTVHFDSDKNGTSVIVELSLQR